MEDSYFFYQLYVKHFFIRNYVYIIIDKGTKEAVIVDPSWELNRISEIINQLNVKVTTILLTHSHFDHTNLVDPIVKLFNSNVYMSAKEIEFYNFKCKNLYPVNHLDKIEIGSTPITCLHTPGHTVGSACYYISNRLFTGDTIFIEGCGACTSKGGSAEDMFHTFQMLKSVIAPHVRIYPGHSFGKKPGYQFGDLRTENIYYSLDKIEHFTKFRMREKQFHLFNFK